SPAPAAYWCVEMKTACLAVHVAAESLVIVPFTPSGHVDTTVKLPVMTRSPTFTLVVQPGTLMYTRVPFAALPTVAFLSPSEAPHDRICVTCVDPAVARHALAVAAVSGEM